MPRFFRRSKTGISYNSINTGGHATGGLGNILINPSSPGPFHNGMIGQNDSTTAGVSMAYILSTTNQIFPWDDSFIEISIDSVTFYNCVPFIVGQGGIVGTGMALRCSGSGPAVFGYFCHMNGGGGGFGTSGCQATNSSSFTIGAYIGNDGFGNIATNDLFDGDLGGSFIGNWRFEAIGQRPVTLNLYQVLYAPDGTRNLILMKSVVHDMGPVLAPHLISGSPGYAAGGAADGNGGSIPHSIVNWHPTGAGQIPSKPTLVTHHRRGSGYYWKDTGTKVAQTNQLHNQSPINFVQSYEYNTAYVPSSVYNAGPFVNLYLSLHSDTPGTTGANEITDPNYSRQASTIGVLQGFAFPNWGPLTNPHTITHVGIWDSPTGGTFIQGVWLFVASQVPAATIYGAPTKIRQFPDIPSSFNFSGLTSVLTGFNGAYLFGLSFHTANPGGTGANMALFLVGPNGVTPDLLMFSAQGTTDSTSYFNFSSGTYTLKNFTTTGGMPLNTNPDYPALRMENIGGSPLTITHAGIWQPMLEDPTALPVFRAGTALTTPTVITHTLGLTAGVMTFT